MTEQKVGERCRSCLRESNNHGRTETVGNVEKERERVCVHIVYAMRGERERGRIIMPLCINEREIEVSP